jgi:hypothetical protein
MHCECDAEHIRFLVTYIRDEILSTHFFLHDVFDDAMIWLDRYFVVGCPSSLARSVAT